MRIVTADVLANARTSAFVLLAAMQAELTLVTLAGFNGIPPPALLLNGTGTTPPRGQIAPLCFVFIALARLILSYIHCMERF